jgi:putative redox protein
MIQSFNLEVPYQVSFTNGSHSGVADVPCEKGGAGRGFGPHELLEAALASCLTMTAQMYAAKHGFPLAGVSSDVRLDRSVPGEVTVQYALTFDGPLSEDQVEQLRTAARECPVGRTLSGKIAIRPTEPVGSADG